MEMYISILEALAYYGPLKLTRITYKANMNYGKLKLILCDLIQKKLVEKRTFGKNNALYTLTPKARTTLLHLKNIKKMLPMT
jgi:predicted transcriptional regulator